MRGVVTDGIYRAAIGRIALTNGTPIGREMGMRTSIVVGAGKVASNAWRD